jgi:hypothetical protein
VPNVTRRRKRLRLPRRYVVRPPHEQGRSFVIWTGLPFVKWLTSHDCITLYDVVFAAPHTLQPATVAHEYAHVKQWRNLGPFRFLRAYLREQRQHGYGGNGFEVAARRYADSIATSRFPRIGA